MLDLKDKRFGKLLVIKRDTDSTFNIKSGVYWICKCDCGTLKSIRSDCLRKRNYTHCGCETAVVKIGDKSKTTASLDRIDSSKGYTTDNIQWVHKDINIMKNDYGNDYFIEICKKVAKNNV